LHPSDAGLTEAPTQVAHVRIDGTVEDLAFFIEGAEGFSRVTTLSALATK
jgi:hypothetical protein